MAKKKKKPTFEGAVIKNPEVAFLDDTPGMVVPLSAFPSIGKNPKIFIGNVEVPSGPGAEDRAVEAIADGIFEDEPKQPKADFDFEKEIAAEIKALEQNSRPGFTPPFDMSRYIREKLGGQILPESARVLCPDREFSFDYRGPDRDYKYEAQLVADDEKQLRALVDQFLGAVNSPFIFGGLKIYLHAAQGHGKAPEHLPSGQVSLKVELIFRASAP